MTAPARRTLPAHELAPVLRVARPSRNLRATAGFYTHALGLEVLATFTDHVGRDGVILGRPGWPYHLELTHQSPHTISPRPTAEDLLVVYLPDQAEWHAAIRSIRATGARPVLLRNAYWDRQGLTFEDPDGYRIVIANIGWP